MNMVAAATVVSLSIARVGTQPSQKGPAEYFTGSVRIDPLLQAKESTRASGAYVTFEPGARSAWHTHPLGQTLIVTAGVGWVQIEGVPIEEDPARRRRVDPARQTALARRVSDDRDDPPRHSGTPQRQSSPGWRRSPTSSTPALRTPSR